MLGPCLAGERQHQAGALLSTCTMGVVHRMRCTVRVSLLAPGMPGDTSTPPPRLSLVGVPSVQKVARYRPASKSLPVAACPVGLPPPWDRLDAPGFEPRETLVLPK